MAEKGNLGVARAIDTSKDSIKPAIQARIDEAHDTVAEKVSEKKEPIADRYDSVNENAVDVLDWREQFRKRPAVWTIGALGLGMLVGYSLGALIEGDEVPVGDSTERQHRAPVEYEAGGPSAFSDQHSYAAHARATARVDGEHAASEVYKSGMIEKFKETRAYDRLHEEVGNLGNRFMNELSNAARTIVLPALFNKLKELITVEHSKKRTAGGTTSRQPDAEPLDGSQTTPTDVNQPPAPPERVVAARSEVGKPAYPLINKSLRKFDRLASDTSAPSGESDMGPSINLNYDDRYERESKLFSRGENRGFAPAKPIEVKPTTTDVRNTDSEDAPHGGDYTYEAGRVADDDKS